MSSSWERTDLDTDELEWCTFVAYRDDTPHLRSFARTAAMFGLPTDTVARTAEANLWAARIAAFDRWRDRRLVRIRLHDRRAAEKRMLDVVDGAIEIMAVEINRMLAEVRAPGAVRRMSVADMARLGEWAYKFRRLLSGQTTESVQYDLSHMSVEQLRELRRLQDLAKKSA